MFVTFTIRGNATNLAYKLRIMFSYKSTLVAEVEKEFEAIW